MSGNEQETPTIVEPPRAKPTGRAKGDTRSEQTRRKRAREASENTANQRRARVKAGMALIEERKAKGELAFVHTNVPDTVDELIDRMTNEAAWRPETRVLHGVMDLNGPLADATEGPTALDRGDAIETVNGLVMREAVREALATPGTGAPTVEPGAEPSELEALHVASPEAIFDTPAAQNPAEVATMASEGNPPRLADISKKAMKTRVEGAPARSMGGKTQRRVCVLIAVTAIALWLVFIAATTPRVAVLDVERVKTAVLARAKTTSLDATYRALDAFDGVLEAAVAELLREERLVLLQAEAVIGVSTSASDVTPEVTRRVLVRLTMDTPTPETGGKP